VTCPSHYTSHLTFFKATCGINWNLSVASSDASLLRVRVSGSLDSTAFGRLSRLPFVWSCLTGDVQSFAVISTDVFSVTGTRYVFVCSFVVALFVCLVCASAVATAPIRLPSLFDYEHIHVNITAYVTIGLLLSFFISLSVHTTARWFVLRPLFTHVLLGLGARVCHARCIGSRTFVCATTSCSFCFGSRIVHLRNHDLFMFQRFCYTAVTIVVQR